MPIRIPRPAPLLATAAVALLGACASARGGAAGACKPADPMFLELGPVYSPCEVDRQAKVVSRGAVPVASAGGGTPRTSCERADIEFVVDAAGTPRMERVRTVRTTSTQFLETVRQMAAVLRYQPAMKNGQPVAQVVRYGAGYTVTVSRAGSPAATRRPHC